MILIYESTSLQLLQDASKTIGYWKLIFESWSDDKDDDDDNNDVRTCTRTTNDLAKLIHVSRVTCEAKGVEFAHDSFITNVKGPTRIVRITLFNF